MTFTAYQYHPDEGKPIRLYEFKIGKYSMSVISGQPGYDQPALLGDTVYRYCDADANITISAGGSGPVVWTGVPTSDSGITLAGEAQGDTYEITMPIRLPLAQRFRLMGPPSQTIALFIYEYHISDPDLQVKPVWVGEVGEVGFPTPDTAKLSCSTIAAAFQRNGLRLSWGRQCPHVLYDAQCTLKLRDHLIAVSITSIVSNDTVALNVALDANLYGGGLLLWQSPAGYNETIGIEEVSGNNVKVLGQVAALAGITSLWAARGCKRNPDACQALGNYANYGGFPHLPQKSPFDGNPTFW